MNECIDNKPQIVGRLTKAKLIKWINAKFKDYEIDDYEVYDIEQTRFRAQDYEAGAAALYIRFRNINDHNKMDLFLCTFKIKELEWYVNNGYELKLDFNQRKIFSLNNLELDVKKNG